MEFACAGRSAAPGHGFAARPLLRPPAPRLPLPLPQPARGLLPGPGFAAAAPHEPRAEQLDRFVSRVLADGAAATSSVLSAVGLGSISKTYSVDAACLSLMGPFAPRKLTVTLLRAAVMHSSKPLQDYIKAMESEDRRGDGEDVPVVPRPSREDWHRVGHRTGFSVARELSVKLAKAAFARLVAATLPARTAWKALKDVSASALRKLARVSESRRLPLLLRGAGAAELAAAAPVAACRRAAAGMVVRTALRAQAVAVVAEFCVQQMLVAYDASRAGWKKQAHRAANFGRPKPAPALGAGAVAAPDAPPRGAWAHFARQTAVNFARAAAALGGVAAGAYLGTLIWPGLGTVLGAAGGEVLAAILVHVGAVVLLGA